MKKKLILGIAMLVIYNHASFANNIDDNILLSRCYRQQARIKIFEYPLDVPIEIYKNSIKKYIAISLPFYGKLSMLAIRENDKWRYIGMGDVTQMLIVENHISYKNKSPIELLAISIIANQHLLFDLKLDSNNFGVLTIQHKQPTGYEFLKFKCIRSKK